GSTVPCCYSPKRNTLTPNEKQHQKIDPERIHEVPVNGRAFQPSGPANRRKTGLPSGKPGRRRRQQLLHRGDGNISQHQESAGQMDAVQSGQYIEKRAVWIGAEKIASNCERTPCQRLAAEKREAERQSHENPGV